MSLESESTVSRDSDDGLVSTYKDFTLWPVGSCVILADLEDNIHDNIESLWVGAAYDITRRNRAQ